ncbi:MAG: AAA family ATPase [Succinivibrio sp.]|nr:AAA family ATPase [Succinivibrio sp.]
MSSNKSALSLKYQASFEDLKKSNGYFVDKTEFIKTVFTDSAKVLLFTRPRRFGKTLLITMFESFLKIDPEKPFDNSKQLDLFKGTKILEDKEFCSKFMGQYPVIDITLKGVNGVTFNAGYKMFADIVYAVANKYKYLLNSSKLDDADKGILRQLTDIDYLENQENASRLKNSLKFLAGFLYKEYGKYPILLIDEYDVPLAKASYYDAQNKKLNENDKNFKADYHYNMVDLMVGFFDILKDKNALTKTVITGCLKVAKNSLFTGVNNFTVNSVVDKEKKYTGIIGFTKDETYQFLKDYELDDYAQKVKEHYAGYKFFDKEIFNPVDVVNFVKDNLEYKENGSEIKTGTYWCDLVSDQELTEHIAYLTDHAIQDIQDLVDGKSITFCLNDSMNYDILSEDNSDDILSLLLHKGYLTIDWEATRALDEYSRRYNNIYAKLPNLEIRDHLIKTFQNRFSSEFVRLNLHNKLVGAFACGKQVEITNIFFDMLQKYVSIRDTATKAPLENYYHGFINGIFTCCEDIISEYHSNYEAGNGYPDITFKAERNTKAVIIEIKATSNDVDMDKLAADALSQIEEKNYALPFTKQSKITEIYAYGIVFCKKDCLVVCKKLK